jgi:hypothetical protein
MNFKSKEIKGTLLLKGRKAWNETNDDRNLEFAFFFKYSFIINIYLGLDTFLDCVVWKVYSHLIFVNLKSVFLHYFLN